MGKHFIGCYQSTSGRLEVLNRGFLLSWSLFGAMSVSSSTSTGVCGEMISGEPSWSDALGDIRFAYGGGMIGGKPLLVRCSAPVMMLGAPAVLLVDILLTPVRLWEGLQPQHLFSIKVALIMNFCVLHRVACFTLIDCGNSAWTKDAVTRQRSAEQTRQNL